MAKGLVYRIFTEGLRRGWFSHDGLVIDPFFGVGSTGIAGSALGVQVFGCELEPRFVELAKANRELHRSDWEHLGLPVFEVVQGDSRNIAAIAREAVGGAVTSPPYAAMDPKQSSPSINLDKQWETYIKQGGSMSLERFREQQTAHSFGYGHTEGQLGAMPAGTPPVGAVTSPPFSQPETRDRYPVQDGSVGDAMTRAHTVDRQTEAPGNIAALPMVGKFTTDATSSTISVEVQHENDMGLDSRVLRGRGEHLLEQREISNEQRGQGGQGGDGPEGQEATGGNLPLSQGAGVRQPDTLPSAGGQWDASSESHLGVGAVPNGGYGTILEGDQRDDPSEAGTSGSGAAVDAASDTEHPNSTDGRSRITPEARVDNRGNSEAAPLRNEEGNELNEAGRDANVAASTGPGLGNHRGLESAGILNERDSGPNGVQPGERQEPHLPTETYWGACRLVYEGLWELFTPNSHLAVVLKSYVKAGKVVDLPGMTLSMLVDIGFEPVVEVRAMLVAEHSQTSMLPEVPEKRKKRSSFFRRLYEAKYPQNAIDYEVCLVVRKPGEKRGGVRELD